MMIVGSVISDSTRPPTSGADRGRPNDLEEDREAEQAEDDRGHRGEVVDVDLDQVGEPVLRRELLEVDRGGDADREADQEADEQERRTSRRWRRARPATSGKRLSALKNRPQLNGVRDAALRPRARRTRRSAASLTRRRSSGASRSTRPLCELVDRDRRPGPSSVSVPPISDGSATTASRTMNWVLSVRMPAELRAARAGDALAGQQRRDAVRDDLRASCPRPGSAGSTCSAEIGKSTRTVRLGEGRIAA